MCVDDESWMIVSYSARFGCVHDSREFKKTLESMDKAVVEWFRIIVGDKGYGSEENRIVAEGYGLFAIITARNEDVPIPRTRGENRKRMMKRHLTEEYNRRSIVETVHSVIKRKSGSFVGSRIPGQLEKENSVKDNRAQPQGDISVKGYFYFIIEGFYKATFKRDKRGREVEVLAVLGYVFHGGCRETSKVLGAAFEPKAKPTVD